VARPGSHSQIRSASAIVLSAKTRGVDSLDVRDRCPGSGRQQEPIEGRRVPSSSSSASASICTALRQQHPCAHPLGVTSVVATGRCAPRSPGRAATPRIGGDRLIRDQRHGDVPSRRRMASSAARLAHCYRHDDSLWRHLCSSNRLPTGQVQDTENPSSPRLLKRPRCKAHHPSSGWVPGPSEAYWKYAAANARVFQRRRWAVFSAC